MATPNNAPQDDTGKKSLTRLIWRDRKTVSKKDGWDKADIIIKGVIGAIIISVFVVIIGGNIQQAVTNQTGKIQESIAIQNTGKDYLTIALNILEQKDLTEEMKQNKGLREWAVKLLNHYSPEQLDKVTAQQLIDGQTTIPIPRNMLPFDQLIYPKTIAKGWLKPSREA